ncbi:hypothetical protein A4A49_51518 [Nicotiana attenuata]|uniref:Uncharacterized protein n=1 Tax=Nicotiana attenuata TaxID=49451 RepID=A0A314L7H6_NICAT|nr:hypothetical protein A4A49_51518 [Nicotiana attenuata]
MRIFLNNARIASPNICNKSASIRCHGIDQVLQEATTLASDIDHNATLPMYPPCHNVTSPPFELTASPPVMSPPSVSSSFNPVLSPLNSGAQYPPVAWSNHVGITRLIWLLVALKLSL